MFSIENKFQAGIILNMQLTKSKYSYFIFAVLFIFCCYQSFAQSAGDRRGDFVKNWHISIGAGQGRLSSEVQSTAPNTTWNLGVRRNINNWFSVQLQYAGGIYKGMNHLHSNNYGNNPAWASKYNAPIFVQAPPPALPGTILLINSVNRLPVTPFSLDPVYYNYRSVLHQLALHARAQVDVSSLLNVYASLGVGVFTYNTNVDALNSDNNPYTALFRVINDRQASGNISRSEVLRDLRAGMDRTYETAAEETGESIHHLPLQFATGFAFRLSHRLELGLEYQFSFTRKQLIDGQRWKENPFGDAALSQKFDMLHNIGINLIFGF
jgi:hypothetical protein